jgi:CDP-glucose 4,6-dehydratase
MEEVGMTPEFWKGRRVFLTGHTGFKGGWLALWLHELGADVHGFALAPESSPNLFEVAGISRRIQSSVLADLRDASAVESAMSAAQPEIVLHLAAQPLVRRSYREPIATYATNVMGTVHVLEAARRVGGVSAIVSVTTDKCYENDGRSHGYVESDPMGGHDPYSSSKGCAELVTSSYRRSFMQAAGIRVATARAGNVIGGGDWSEDRLVPDFLRSIDRSVPLAIRSPDATRPWQHVLEPLSGYLQLAESLAQGKAGADDAWNFGPEQADIRPVRCVLDQLCARVEGASWRIDAQSTPHEAALLSLDNRKARVALGWAPRWPLDTALDATLEWHLAWRRGADMASECAAQIRRYLSSPPLPAPAR